MTIKEAHILIEQGLQNLSSFAYRDILPEEKDIAIDKTTYDFIRAVFKPDTANNDFQDHQITTDDLRVLEEKDYSIDVVSFKDGYKAEFPSNYIHLISDRSVVVTECGDKEFENRVIKSEKLRPVLGDSWTKTVPNSPVSNESGNFLYVYTDNFTIKKVYIDYIRKPRKVSLANDVNPELPDNVMHVIIDKTILRLSKVTEQPQQKIINLSQDN